MSELTFISGPFTGNSTSKRSSWLGWRCRPTDISAMRCARRASPRSVRITMLTSGRGLGNMGFGTFLGSSGPDSKESGMIPGPDALCVCGTEKPYGKCCRKYHVAQSSPWQAEDLLRSRYSAYAFQLTSYIMRTTHSSTAELDRRKWRRDILQFCREYNFVGGVDIMEQSMTGPNATSILFRANLRQRQNLVSFLEMSNFTRESNIWYYVSGKLVDIEDS